MKLIALVIKQYDELFKNQIFNFSDEYKVSFDFETNELKIDKNPDYIENFYGESIYNISPIVGINGTGKTTVLNIISGYRPDKFEQDPDNQYFFLFELGKQEDKVRFSKIYLLLIYQNMENLLFTEIKMGVLSLIQDIMIGLKISYTLIY